MGPCDVPVDHKLGYKLPLFKFGADSSKGFLVTAKLLKKLEIFVHQYPQLINYMLYLRNTEL